jgi:hypothetical protein
MDQGSHTARRISNEITRSNLNRFPRLQPSSAGEQYLLSLAIYCLLTSVSIYAPVYEEVAAFFDSILPDNGR